MKNKLGNNNEDTNYPLKCIFCGADKGLSLVAHRNDNNSINGFVVVCHNCLTNISNDNWYIRTELIKEKGTENIKRR